MCLTSLSDLEFSTDENIRHIGFMVNSCTEGALHRRVFARTSK